MFRGIMVAIFLFALAAQTQAQLSSSFKERGIYQYDLVKGTQSNGVKPLGDLGDQFISPTDSLIKQLQRQVEFQFLPSSFIPSIESETESFKRKALRYAIAYYRDCQVTGIQGFVDVLIGLRFDTRSGPLDVKYYRV